MTPMVDLGLLIGLTCLGIAYLLHMRWYHKPKRHNDGSESA